MDTRVFELIQKHPYEFYRVLNKNEDLPSHLYEELYDIFWKEMPYGTAKARTGDPYQWILQRLLEEVGTIEIF